MPSYKVLEPGFFQGIYRTSGHPKHGIVITDKPLDPVPKWLSEIKGETVAKADIQLNPATSKPYTKAELKKLADEKAAAEKLAAANKIDTTSAGFLSPTGSNDTPEKL